MQEIHAPYPLEIKALIDGLPEPVIALSILEGWTEGRVFVDDARKPRVALIWETKNNLFLSGEPGREIATEIEALFREAIVPSGERSGRMMSFLAYSPWGWSDYLPSMLGCRPPIPDRRMCYTLDPREPDAAEALSTLAVVPEGCDLRSVNKALLASPGAEVTGEGRLENLDEVRSEILKQWSSLDDFDARGFGYCLVLRDGEAGLERSAGGGSHGVVSSWCLTEYPAGNEISIGVETVEEHQKKGYGTVVAAATIRECVQRGLTPYWDLWLSNTPSKALAEKVGLKHLVSYPVVFFYYNEVNNLLVNANVAFRRDNRPDIAVQWYEKAFVAAESEEVRKSSMLARVPVSRRWSLNAAEAYFKAGLREEAMAHIDAAKRHGLTEDRVAEFLRNLV